MRGSEKVGSERKWGKKAVKKTGIDQRKRIEMEENRSKLKKMEKKKKIPKKNGNKSKKIVSRERKWELNEKNRNRREEIKENGFM